MFSKKRKKKKKAQIGTTVRARVFNVSLHPEGPATGQLDQDFPWFSLVQGQMLSWYQIPRCTACFTCSPPNGDIKNFALMYTS
jgi:hypothetical protein